MVVTSAVPVFGVVLSQLLSVPTAVVVRSARRALICRSRALSTMRRAHRSANCSRCFATLFLPITSRTLFQSCSARALRWSRRCTSRA